MNKYCLKCMEPLDEKGECVNGCDSKSWIKEPHSIRPGRVLYNKYLVGYPIGQNGLYITYIGRDLILHRIVTIKEYYPIDCANRNTESSLNVIVYNPKKRVLFEEGKIKFLEESKSLGKFQDHLGIVNIIECFEANNTAYIVMEYDNTGSNSKKLEIDVNPLPDKKKFQKEDSSLKENKRGVVLKVLLLVILVAIVAVSAITIYNNSTRSIVPELEGETVERAEILLEQNNLQLGNVDYEYSENVEKGSIVRQDIKSGTEIKKDQIINLVISKGELYTMPNVAGKSLKKAKSIFAEYNLVVEVEEEKWSDDVKKGNIISQNPQAGKQVEEGTSVLFVVSKGVEIVKVPDVEGKSISKAKDLLEKNKLKYEVVEEYHEKMNEDDVISQSVSAGKNVEKNTKVVLKVSKGKKPEPVVKQTKKKRKPIYEKIEDWESIN